MAKVISEIGINANGQMQTAKNLITMAKLAGADAVKFQKRTVDIVYAGQMDNPRNDGNPYGWKTVGEQKKGLEFSLEQYAEIDRFCKEIGIPWFYSAWDCYSFEDMQRFDCPYNKIASAMMTNMDFCWLVAEKQIHTFISTGGCSLDQVKLVVNAFLDCKTDFTLLHCVSTYPCPDDLLNLNVLDILRRVFPYAEIGYSGHEVGIYPSIMALSLGAKWIERHITMDRSMYGSDQAASMEYNGLKSLCEVAHKADAILGDGHKRFTLEEAKVMKKLRYWEA